MLVSELFEALSYGELSNLAVAGPVEDSALGSLEPSSHGKVLLAVNDSLSYLFSNYILSRDMQEVTTSTDEKRYVVTDPLLVQILYADMPEYASDSYVYGDPGNVKTVRLTILDRSTIIFDDFPPETVMKVTYQTLHPKLTKSAGYLDQEITLPEFMYEPLRALAASKVFSNMNGEVALAKSAEQANKFAGLIAVLEANGMVDKSIPMVRRDFSESGLV